MQGPCARRVLERVPMVGQNRRYVSLAPQHGHRVVRMYVCVSEDVSE
jgi:hypothetical protein